MTLKEKIVDFFANRIQGSLKAYIALFVYIFIIISGIQFLFLSFFLPTDFLINRPFFEYLKYISVIKIFQAYLIAFVLIYDVFKTKKAIIVALLVALLPDIFPLAMFILLNGINGIVYTIMGLPALAISILPIFLTGFFVRIILKVESRFLQNGLLIVPLVAVVVSVILLYAQLHSTKERDCTTIRNERQKHSCYEILSAQADNLDLCAKATKERTIGVSCLNLNKIIESLERENKFNLSDCPLFTETKAKDFCYTTHAKRILDPNICDSVLDIYAKNSCYISISNATSVDISVCKKMSQVFDGEGPLSCAIKVAVDKKDITLCKDSIFGERREYCAEQVIDRLSVDGLSPSLCNGDGLSGQTREDYEQKCLIKIAYKFKYFYVKDEKYFCDLQYDDVNKRYYCSKKYQP